MKSRNKINGILLRNSRTTQTKQTQQPYTKSTFKESTLSTITSHQTLQASKKETYKCSPIVSTSKQIPQIKNKRLFNIRSFVKKSNPPYHPLPKKNIVDKTSKPSTEQSNSKRYYQRQNSLTSLVSVNSLTTTTSNSFKLMKSNSSVSFHSGGTVNIISIPTKINSVKLNLYEHNSVIRFDIRKVILIQSFIRMYLLRKMIYMEAIKSYKIQKGVCHIEKAFEINCAYLKWLAFYKINKDEEIKYYINEKEFELLNELKKWKITSVEDYNSFTFWIAGDEEEE
jgi:hypothetical protein